MQMVAPTPEHPTSAEPVPPAMAFVLDHDSEGVLRRCFTDIGIAWPRGSRWGSSPNWSGRCCGTRGGG